MQALRDYHANAKALSRRLYLSTFKMFGHDRHRAQVKQTTGQLKADLERPTIEIAEQKAQRAIKPTVRVPAGRRQIT